MVRRGISRTSTGSAEPAEPRPDQQDLNRISSLAPRHSLKLTFTTRVSSTNTPRAEQGEIKSSLGASCDSLVRNQAEGPTGAEGTSETGNCPPTWRRISRHRRISGLNLLRISRSPYQYDV
eukprot:gene19456-26118_t